jgi:tetratricopeptide (TPR) repeat protein
MIIAFGDISHLHRNGRVKKSSIVNENYRKALNLAEEELSVNPRNVTLLISIAGYHAELGQISVAKDLLFDVLEQSDDDFSIVGDIGRTFERLGERELALDVISKAIRNGYPVSEIKSDPNLNEFRDDPGYITFIEEWNHQNIE